jgi:hypothetical protein
MAAGIATRLELRRLELKGLELNFRAACSKQETQREKQQ